MTNSAADIFATQLTAPDLNRTPAPLRSSFAAIGVVLTPHIRVRSACASGLGTADGAAITDDFESTDRKLMRYSSQYLQAVMAPELFFYVQIVNKLTFLTSIKL